jgi:uncharacterized protein
VSLAHGAIVAAAAFVAGAINSVAGGGSLISFPALVAIGYAPITANVTNAVAVLPGYLGGSIAYRRELDGQRRRLERLGAVSAAGAVAGGALLLAGPEVVFEWVAPCLILLACALLALQARLASLRPPRREPRGRLSRRGLAAQFAVAVYGGYFGAGLGIMMMAVLELHVNDDLQRLNALKGALSLAVGVAAGIFFVVFAPIAWGAAATMAVASLLGGHFGVRIARRLSSSTLRIAVIAFGLAAAAYLFTRIGG